MTQAAPEVLVGDREPDAVLEQDAPAAKKIAGRSPTQIAMSRLRKDKVAVTCAVIVLIIVVAAIFAGFINNALHITNKVSGPYALDPNTATDFYSFPLPEYGPPNGSFTFAHPLGIAPRNATDNLATMLVGLRNSLLVASIATVATTLIGLTVGLVSGFSRGPVDRALSFIIDLFLSFPFILFALAVAPIITQRFATDSAKLQQAQVIALVVVLSTLSWMGLARLVRGQVLQLREREFVLAAQVLGASTRRILFKELLPNLVATLVVVLSMSIPLFIAAEVGLSYLGLGLNNSMGQLIQSATQYYDSYPIYLWVPVAVLVILVLALNLLGDSIRDAFDPKTRR
ncbi:ABC transporter permease [Nocardioides rubriscoriae]|uniref:ABC transporter permease n=1 Tax=Nocardioides rubriscoriae TaxID=642762 RepID=UPI0011E01D4A|nr:ABC transporter permease [Nocardioides rubriscoriae]